MEDISQAFLQDGMVPSLSLLSPDKTKLYREEMVRFVAAYGEHPSYKDWTYFKSHIVLHWVAQIAAEPEVLDAVERVLGPDIQLWNSFLPIKPPKSGGHFGWHQDGTFWDIAPLEETVTVWLALDAVSLTNGGMRMIRGSHRRGQMMHEVTYDPNSMLRRGQRIDGDIDESAAEEVPLSAGQASLHNAMILHGSAANDSADWRYAVGLNYVSGNVKPINGYRDSAWVVRGKRQVLGFEDEQPAQKRSPTAAALREYDICVTRSASRYDFGQS